MIRDLGRLASGPFDLLVVGGGIYGLTAAYDAALRGLRVALVERHDFGGGASFNHYKTLHGGLRYLQSGDLRRMRQSIAERRAFAIIAPQLISLQAFVMPTRATLARSRAALSVAFRADRLVGSNRNTGVPLSHELPHGRVISREDLLQLVPQAAELDATGAALWYDYKTDEGERLTLAFALAASRHGAVLANYVDAVEPLRDGSRIAGMRVRDTLTGDPIDVRARITLNAAGAGAGRLMAAFGARRVFPLLKAMNVVTRRTASGVAFGAPTTSGRLLIALPWRGRLLIGTWHGPEFCGADQTMVTAGEIDAFTAEINSAFPWLKLQPNEITLVNRGIVPARTDARHGPTLLEHGEIRDHRADGIEGAFSIVGVKYTTARLVAEQAVTQVGRALGERLPKSRTGQLPLISPLTAGSHDEPPKETLTAAERIARLYGATSARVLGLQAEHPELATPLTADVAVTPAEVLEAVRHEMALTLEDVIVRRTSLGVLGYPGDELVAACGAVVQQELGWSDERLADEIEGVRRFYAIAESVAAAGE